jgi:RHS repeat-associated protein
MKINIIKVFLIANVCLSFPSGSAFAQEFVQYVHTDALGSPVAISDASGTIIERTDYEPYGDVIGEVKRDRPGYTGHVSDSATALTYMQQRYYDPELGLFLSSDPVGPMNHGFGQFNRYRYANGNPYTNVDPDGRQCTGSRIRAVCEAGGVAGLQTSTRGAGAARQANNALKAADAFRPFESKSDMYQLWAKQVEPVSESWGFEIASLIYKAGGGRYRVGPAHSDGLPTSVGGVLSAKPGGESGLIHTHPNTPVMSASDVAVSRVSGRMYSVGKFSDWGDLTTAVSREIDVAMVHHGRVYEFSFEQYQRVMASPSNENMVRLGDLVREVK